MIARRDLVIGAACAVAAGAAYGLTPRRHVSLLGQRQLADIIPLACGAWIGRDVGDLIAPKVEGSLSSRLYNQTVERIYSNSSGAEVMMLVAYGDTQSNELQLHRPEVCYPAFGLEIVHNIRFSLPLVGAAVLPVRRLLADGPGRLESITYWTRLGEFLPLDESEQRLDRVRTALRGIIADGVLARFSALSADPQGAWPMVEDLILALLKAVNPSQRRVLIGTRLAGSMASAGI